MKNPTRNRTTPLATRLVALVLVCAFVLQSAAQAGQGCLARVFTGACCCTAVDPALDMGAAPERSCCAGDPEQARGDSSDAPRVEWERGCACASAPQPSAPVVPQAPDVAAERSWERILHAQPIALVACTAASAPRPVEQRTLGRPPPVARIFDASFARTRLAQRGVSGLLSELCTLLR
jgi:hypothetical protein